MKEGLGGCGKREREREREGGRKKDKDYKWWPKCQRDVRKYACKNTECVLYVLKPYNNTHIVVCNQSCEFYRF